MLTSLLPERINKCRTKSLMEEKERRTMTTLARENKASSATLLRPNPVLRRLSKAEDRAVTGAATYTGIASKTCFFLALTMLGMIAQLLVASAFANAPVWQSFTFYGKFTVDLTLTETVIAGAVLLGGFAAEMLGIFVRKTVPVTGSLYAASQGYVISFLVFKVLKGYEYLGLEALLLTIAVIAAMSWLYTSGRIRVNGKFRTVLFSLLIGSVVFGVFTLLGSLVPFTRPFVQGIFANPALAIGLDVLGIVLASLFLVSDFSMIDTCVKEGYAKEYEWTAAFGLVFTVIWLYLKILELIIRIAGNSKK